MSSHLALALAIIAEVIATSYLKASVTFTRPLPSVIVVVGYASAFYFLAIALRSIPIGVAYAIWSGVGVLLVTVIAWVVYGQKLDALSLAAMGLIMVGALILNLRAVAGG